MWRALMLVGAVLLGCGGRSTLDPGESDGLAPAPPASHAEGGSSSHPTPGTPKPGPGSGPDPVPGAGSGPDPVPGAGSGSDPGPDPVPGAGSGPGPNPGPDPAPMGDVNCTSDDAKGGMACTQPCVTTCGFYELGTRSCDCVSGVFVSCHCPRPWNYQGPSSAPPCSTPDGRTHWLDNPACTDEWAECVGSDPVSGTNPRGCVCLTDPVNGKLEWTCGSTNKWFLPE